MNTKGVTLQQEFEKAIVDMGYTELTEIQEKCIPLIQQGKDIIGLAYTGSGKTAAYGLPSLEKILPKDGIQMLVIVPTRELCTQVAEEFRKYTKYRKTKIVEIYGGMPMGPQVENLRRGDVIVGTPGRLLDHLSRGTFDLYEIKVLVLDEADKMFDMGFVEDIEKIIAEVPKNSQKLLFGATMPAEIMKIVKKYLDNPEKITLRQYVDRTKLIQSYYEVSKDDKFSLLVHLLKKEQTGATLIFCGTRNFVDMVNTNLNKQNINSEALHGGVSQYKRNQIMGAYKDGKINVLVATDVAARGIDVKNIGTIINYDLPRAPEEYVHRIGRTARAGTEGKAISLLTGRDSANIRRIFGDNFLSVHKMKNPQFEHVSFIMMETEHEHGGDYRRSRGREGSDRRPASKYKSFSRSRNNKRW
ncbi:MAG: ATP-dependent helicase [Candidatus Altiarchaeales archaeon HGW-Altiarchaeales-2]|nr:MAG: ATP-dependent helicase [Candidatus Altiarchaeales archaeon HGW-Altiarchaeales-2]